MKPIFTRTPILLFLVTASVASAQGSSGDAASETLDEIIVSAQKREQNVFEVPMAVSTFSGTELERRGITAISELQFAVPGMTMREDGPGSNTIFLRGIVNQYGNGAVVGQYLDEVPVTLTAFDQLDIRTLDLERIEVLKGPQGTLYGQGSVAGTVRYITKKPVLDRVEGSLSLAAGFIDDGDTESVVTGVINGPLAEDKFGIRIAGRFQNGGGWQDQPAAGIEDGNDQDLVNIRATALWRVNDILDIEAKYIHHKNESELGLGYENPDRTIFVAGDPATVLIPKIQEYAISNLTISASFGKTLFTSATSYIDNDHQYPFAYQCGVDTNCDPFEGN
ncbi:MAG: TonB-dependent receptor plug domain-containing protein, partial [Proteobacteria bacterium]|nr:TonB-dependent receptor plug domain-containing protein [Pseudomonadota bacterium]